MPSFDFQVFDNSFRNSRSNKTSIDEDISPIENTFQFWERNAAAAASEINKDSGSADKMIVFFPDSESC